MAADSASALLRGQAKGLGGSSLIAFMRDQTGMNLQTQVTKKKVSAPVTNLEVETQQGRAQEHV